MDNFPYYFFKTYVVTRARETVCFAGSGPIFETENRFISRQEAEQDLSQRQDSSPDSALPIT